MLLPLVDLRTLVLKLLGGYGRLEILTLVQCEDQLLGLGRRGLAS